MSADESELRPVITITDGTRAWVRDGDLEFLVEFAEGEWRRVDENPTPSAAAEAIKAKDAAYAERNRLAAALSKLFPASLERHPDSDTDWEDDWRWIVFIDLPTGQASWHIHDSELGMFDHLTRDAGRTWDGHTTEEKYERVAQLKPSAAAEGADDYTGESGHLTDLQVREDWDAINEVVPEYQMQHASGETEEASLVERVEYLVLDAKRKPSAAAEGEVETLKRAVSFLLGFAPKDVPPGLDPTFYHTGTYEGDTQLQQRVDELREALAPRQQAEREDAR